MEDIKYSPFLKLLREGTGCIPGAYPGAEHTSSMIVQDQIIVLFAVPVVFSVGEIPGRAEGKGFLFNACKRHVHEQRGDIARKIS